MKKIICILIIFFCILLKVEAQVSDYDSVKKNGIQIELYPFNWDENLGLISLQYERVFGKKKQTMLKLGVTTSFNDEDVYISFPIIISGIVPSLGSHQFEYGIGVALSLYYDTDNPNQKLWTDVPYLIAPVMYRYQSENGLFFRGGINCYLGYGGLLANPSFGLGYRF